MWVLNTEPRSASALSCPAICLGSNSPQHKHLYFKLTQVSRDEAVMERLIAVPSDSFNLIFVHSDLSVEGVSVLTTEQKNESE